MAFKWDAWACTSLSSHVAEESILVRQVLISKVFASHKLQYYDWRRSVRTKYLTNLHFYNTWSYYRNTSHSWLTPQKCSALVTFAFTGEVASLPAVARCMSALGLIVPQEVVRFPHPSTTVREMHPSSTCQNPVNFQVWHLDCLTDTCAVDVFCDSWRDRSSSNFWFVIESMVTSCSHLHCPAFVLETLVDFFQIY